MKFLSGLKPAWFVLALGLWTLLLKPVLMAVSFGAETFVVPDLISPLIAVRPLEWLAGGHIAGNLLLLGVALPLLATAWAQLIPLYGLRKRITRPWVRIVLSLAAMGLIYTLAFGRLGFFLSGVGLGLPLMFAFEVQLRQGSARRAFLITAGIHGFANAAVVVLLVALGGL